MDAGHAAVGEQRRARPSADERGLALPGHRQVGRAGRDHQRAGQSRRRRAPDHRRQSPRTWSAPVARPVTVRVPPGWSRAPGSAWSASARVRMTGPTVRSVGQQLAHDGRALLRRLALAVDGLGQPLAQRPVVVDLGEAEVGEGQATETEHGVVGGALPRADSSRRRCSAGSSMMFTILPVHGPRRILRRRPATAGAADRLPRTRGHLHRGGAPDRARPMPAPTITPFASLVDVLEAVRTGTVDLGFIPMENAIEGTVRDIIDSLVFDFDLRIQREVVLDIHLHLMAPPGHDLGDVERVASIPVATAQCRRFLTENLPDGGDGGHQLDSRGGPAPRRGRPGHAGRPTAAIAPRLAASLYGLEILAEDVEDHPDNQTRFVAVARTGIPAPTGHDRTSIVCFQSADHPGSLHAILGQFAARNINLIEARVPADQAGPGRLLLHHRLRRPRGRRGGGRLPAATSTPSWPGSSSSARTRPPGRPGPPSGPRSGRRAAGRRVARRRCGTRSPPPELIARAPAGPGGRRPTATLATTGRDGRADECTALEKPRGASLRGFESPSLRVSDGVRLPVPRRRSAVTAGATGARGGGAAGTTAARRPTCATACR